MTPLVRRPRRASGRSSKIGGRLVGLLLLIAACWAALLVAAPAPAQDPVLVSVSPGDGEFAKSPAEVRLTFDRSVPAELATVRMTKPSGEQVVTERPHNPPDAPDTIAVPMPQTRYAGTYSVAWAVPSTRLEPITGTFGFHVFAPKTPVNLPQISTEPDAAVTAAHLVTRLAATAGLTIGLGVTFLFALVWPAGVRHAPARRLIKYAWWTVVVATLATIVTFGGHAARTSLREAFDPALLAGTLKSDIGAALLARLLVLLPITFGLVLLLTDHPAETAAERWSAAGSVLAGGAALAASWSFARPGDPGGPTPAALGADIALLLAASACVGGPVLLWMLLRGAPDSVLRDVAPRLARVMPVCALLLLVIAVTTARGWQLVALLVLVALGAGTAAAGHVWMRRREQARGRDLRGRARLRRLVAAAAAASAVALVAAAATASAPGHSQLALTTSPVDASLQSQPLHLR